MYSSRLRTEMAVKDHPGRTLALQERLNGLSAAINALQLVHPAYAWIDSIPEDSTFNKDDYPSKKARITTQEQCELSIHIKQFFEMLLECPLLSWSWYIGTLVKHSRVTFS